ncbi:MAG: hypothetical protein GX760_06075 [Erysipelothrix sp.]|nr:hypothetical protein [Erysipelothrix sp.]
MERFLELLIQFLQNRYVLIVLFIFLIITIFSMLRKNKNVKVIDERLAELEIDYNTIKSMPLTFKLNKARSLAKVKDEIKEEIENYVNSYETIQKAIERMDELFLEAAEAKEIDELDVADVSINEIEQLVSITLVNVEKLNTKLDSVLEKELKLRSDITSFKERFREIKETITKRNGVYNFSEDVLNEYISIAENEFSAFDEWMYVSEFDKANISLEKIENVFKKLDQMLVELPNLLPYAKEIIPNKIADVSTLYSEVLDSNLFVDDLNVTQSLATISKSLTDNLSDLRNGDVDKVRDSLESSDTNLDGIKERLQLELAANTTLVELSQTVKNGLNNMSVNLNKLNEQYDALAVRYSFEHLESQIKQYEQLSIDLTKDNMELNEKIKVPMAVSAVVQLISDFNDKLSVVNDDIDKSLEFIHEIESEEKRANQQLVKLYLIINEVSVKINEHNIQSISNDYLKDVDTAKQHIKNIEDILAEKQLNIKLLNSTLSESIDYIYKLYNNVNNIVGMAIMVENAIVFTNRYRTSSAEVDRELTKSEFYFRNGEYTQALTTVLNILEKIHPHDYEQMIREKAIYVL